ncbi:MAG: non-heme iron oxygenase ferredoxin subunit [Pseudomonadota bacterium]|nr:non-heme iron oxygenase ferredoxin subunit [Pseudomonadota bacterium]
MSGAWTPVSSLDDFAASDAIAIVAAGKEIAIYLVGGAVFATANRCTHGDARLCDGWVEGHEIECPLHQGRFDVRTGAATGAPAEVALATYPARLAGDRVELQLG